MTEISKNAQVPQCDKTTVKCRFFAQYWGQNILSSTHFENIKAVMFNYDLFGALNTAKGLISATEAFKTYFLWLKPLSKITDEDLEFIYQNKKINVDIDKDVYLSKKLSNFVESDIYLTDYLRSKGYALPFMEYSVEDLVSFGWVQLI